MVAEFSVTALVRDGFQVFALKGELALDGAHVLEEAFGARTDSLPVIVDLTGLSVLGSSGVQALLQKRGGGRPVAIVRLPRSSTARVLDIVQAQLVAPLFDELAEAIESLGTAVVPKRRWLARGA